MIRERECKLQINLFLGLGFELFFATLLLILVLLVAFSRFGQYPETPLHKSYEYLGKLSIIGC